MPLPNRPIRTTLLMVLAALFFMPAALAQTPIPPATPATASSYDPASLHAIKPELREEIAVILPAGLTEYVIDVAFPQDPSGRILDGRMTVVYTNTTGGSLDAIPFRLYANSASENNDAITLGDVTVDGTAATPELSELNSVATIPLATPLENGDATTIDIAFTTTIPNDEPAHYGMLNYATGTSTWSIAHWYPMVAGWDPGYGWMMKPTSVNGDPVFTDTGMYTVTITAPDDLQLITSGVEIDRARAGEGMTTTTWSAAPSRDFVMLADADMTNVQHDVAGTTVTSWYNGATAPAGRAALRWSVQSLELFNSLLGEYPYQSLQVVPAAMFNAAGVEYPQLFVVSEGYYDRPIDLAGQGYFEFTVAHEVIHQWLYGIVGNNQYDHAYIDEGLTNYLSSRVYFTAIYGEEIGEAAFERYVRTPFEYMVEANNDVVVATETDAFPTGNAYVNAAYIKAPMGFFAIHEALGDDAFFAGLQAYVEQYRFRVATPADLLAAWQAVTDEDVAALWTHWFERREGALDIRD